MTYAVISDIHANLPALQEVLKDIDALGVEELYCLDDVVGYGPDPTPCADRDPRAYYALAHEEGESLRIEWRRVAYAFEETIARVLAQPRLDDQLGLRLRHGA